jgi:hypothetical protein
MAKVWVLDTETKGTGANVVPLEKVVRSPADRADPPKPSPQRRERSPPPPPPAPTALPPGHVRKKATGEIGKVLAVDSRAGTATVRWLRSGASSTVPLSSVARR